MKLNSRVTFFSAFPMEEACDHVLKKVVAMVQHLLCVDDIEFCLELELDLVLGLDLVLVVVDYLELQQLFVGQLPEFCLEPLF